MRASLVRDELGRKRCKACESWLDVSMFTPNRATADRLLPQCRPCVASRHKARRYGMSVVEWRGLLDSQGGRCAACGADEPGVTGWQTDHDHGCCPRKGSCGRCVRGLLCNGCNSALGHVGDDRGRLLALVAYLDRASS